jgi:hypothetical protein
MRDPRPTDIKAKIAWLWAKVARIDTKPWSFVISNPSSVQTIDNEVIIKKAVRADLTISSAWQTPQ